MPTLVGTLVGLGLVVVGLVGAGYGWKRYRIYRLVAGTPTTDARSVVEEGVVELTGEVVAGETMDSPIRGVDCVLAGWLAEEWDESGDGSHWATIATGVEATPFRLDDGTGTVRVEVPSRASGSSLLASVSDLVASKGVALDDVVCEFRGFEPLVEVGVDEHPPEHLRNFLARSSAVSGSESSLFNVLDFGNQHGDRRYSESVVRPGDDLYLLGYARRTGRGAGGAGEEWGSNADAPAWTVGAPPSGQDGLLLVSKRRKSALIDAAKWRAGALPVGVALVVAGVALLAGRVPV